ncbi:hypothetical protein SE92_00770 [Bradyrhizobium sp. AT1]|nr:hypothetical protein SE92_00770 [Bradyrhizobium sp. AT1]
MPVDFPVGPRRLMTASCPAIALDRRSVTEVALDDVHLEFGGVDLVRISGVDGHLVSSAPGLRDRQFSGGAGATEYGHFHAGRLFFAYGRVLSGDGRIRADNPSWT